MQTVSFDQACENVTSMVIAHATQSVLAVERANVRADTANNRMAAMESSIQGYQNYVGQQVLRTRQEAEYAIASAENAMVSHREAAQSHTTELSDRLAQVLALEEHVYQCYFEEVAYAHATEHSYQRVTEEACEKIAQVETEADLAHTGELRKWK